MRRAFAVIAATAGSLFLLANFHTTPGTTPLAVAAGPPSPKTASSASSTSRPPAGVRPPGTTAATTSLAGPARPTTTAPVTRTIVGPVVPNDYGDVQVRLTLTGTRIVDAEALVLPTDRRRSREISNFAAPRLRSEVLQAQSARIDVVSGASYTSDSYAQSVQGALDNA